MSLFVAIKTGSGPQTTKQLGRAEATPGLKLRGLCVHLVGGDSGKTLTPNRRDSIRKAHNKKAHGGGRCSLHVKEWKSKLAHKCGVVSARPPAPSRPVPAPPAQAQVAVPPVAQVAVPPVAQVAVPPVAQVAVPPMPQLAYPRNERALHRAVMDFMDDNRDNMSDGSYLRMANLLQRGFRQAGPQ